MRTTEWRCDQCGTLSATAASWWVITRRTHSGELPRDFGRDLCSYECYVASVEAEIQKHGRVTTPVAILSSRYSVDARRLGGNDRTNAGDGDAAR